MEHLSYPPPVQLAQNSETKAMIDCIYQLQTTLKQHVLCQGVIPVDRSLT